MSPAPLRSALLCHHTGNAMKFSALFATLVLASGLTSAAHAADPEYLRIIGTDTQFVAKNA
jgi:hypothetical protein